MTNTANTTETVTLRLYNVSDTLVMAYSEADALRKIGQITEANLTDYPEVQPGRTMADVELPTTATLH